MTEKAFPCTSEGLVASQALLESACDSPKSAIVMDETVSNIVRCSGASGFTISKSVAYERREGKNVLTIVI